MFYWLINHPLKQFLPFAGQRGRALLRSNTSLAKVATLSWQPPVFGTGYHASAFSAGMLLSRRRENLKAKSYAGVWETPGCQLLGLSFFPNCTNTSSSDLGPPWVSPSWAHFTRYPFSPYSSACKPHFCSEEPSILVLQYLLLFLTSPSPNVTLALNPGLCIDPKPDLNHTLFSCFLSKEHYWSTSPQSKCPSCFLVIGSVRKCFVTMLKKKKITNLSLAVYTVQWNIEKSCRHTRTFSLGCRHIWTVISRGWKGESDFTTLFLK